MTHSPGQLTILLAEDEPADVHLLRLALLENDLPAELHHVSDGREALAYLRRLGTRFAAAVRPDLILLDLNMPRMDGCEFLAAIKADAALNRIPVVVLSTSVAERDVVAARRLGAAGYIAKSADLDVFFGDVRQLRSYWSACARAVERAGQ